MAVVEEFCMAVKDKWPNCLIQFEDFETTKAFSILERMRDRVLCFNDDIQGTGAVVTTGSAYIPVLFLGINFLGLPPVQGVQDKSMPAFVDNYFIYSTLPISLAVSQGLFSTALSYQLKTGVPLMLFDTLAASSLLHLNVDCLL